MMDKSPASVVLGSDACENSRLECFGAHVG